MDKFFGKDARRIIQNNNIVDQAFIDLAQTNAPKLFERITIPLDNARTLGDPLKLGFAFTSVFVEEATDSSTSVEFRPFNSNVGSNGIQLKKNGSLPFEYPVKNAILTWDAQAGKSITLVFIFYGQYYPGSLLTEIASGVDGNSISVPNSVAVTTSPTLLAAQNLNRKVLDINSDIDILIGPSVTGNFYPIGKSKTISNTAAIYAITVSGTATVNLLEQE